MPTAREVILIALLSGALALICSRAFTSNPASRRWLIIQLTTIFCIIPVILSLVSASWSIGITGASQWAPGRVLSQPLVFVVTGCGMILAIVRIVGVLHDRLRIARLPLQDAPGVRDLIATLSHVTGCKRSVDVRTGLSPCSTSLGRATIILPANSADWNEQTMRGVLAHEIVHIRRQDDLWLHQIRLVSDFFWWLPWLRMLPRALETAIEESCDDVATGIVCNTPAYFEALYEVAVAAHSPSAVAAGGSDLLRRFQRFNGLREEQVDYRGLFWSCAGALILTTGVWSARFTEPLYQPINTVRIVALIRSAPDSQTLAVSLQPQPLKTPVLEVGARPLLTASL